MNESVIVALVTAGAAILSNVILSNKNSREIGKANFDRAIALFPDHFEAHLAKGRLLVERGDTDTAAVHLEAASRIHPDDWRPLAYLGDIDRAISDPARAMARYLAAHDLAPKETRVITRLVSLSEDLGDEESAVRYRALLKGLRRPPKKK